MAEGWSTSRWLSVALVAVVGWYVISFATWAVRPMHDTVPIEVLDESVAGVEEPDTTVKCHSPLSGNTEPDGSVLPQLHPSREYPRPACKEPIQAARRLLAIDTVIALAASGLLLHNVNRRRGGST